MEYYKENHKDYSEDEQSFYGMSHAGRIEFVRSAIENGHSRLPEYMKSTYDEITQPQKESSSIDLRREISVQYGDVTADAFSMYTKLDTNDQAEVRGEMKHMLKSEKYLLQEESKNA